MYRNENRNYSQTLLWVLLLTPVWWILGFNIFVYQLSTLAVFIQYLYAHIKNQDSIAIPRTVILLFFFGLTFLLSIFLNVSEQPAQRLWAAGNNWTMFAMGFFLTLIIYDESSSDYFENLFKIAKHLSVISAILTLFGLGLWVTGYRTFEIDSLIGRIFPFLMDFPFFYFLLTLRLSGPDWMIQNLPRVSLYSAAYVTTGDFMVMILPLFLGSLSQKKFRLRNLFLIIFCLLPLFFSLSRMAICAFVGAYIFVHALNKNQNLILSLFWLFLTAGLLFFLYTQAEWLLNLRIDSTIGRMGLYEDAVKIVFEMNPWLGLGVRLREGFTMMAIGSHSTYIGILLATGIAGLALFTSFQVWIFIKWYQTRVDIKNVISEDIWKSLGMSFMGANIIFLTSSIDAVPLIAFIYFLVIGSILLFSRRLKEEKLCLKVQRE